ncbi:MAG: hypothetical protein IKL47_10790 [Clostridia bacterium]|nr:hypothetical protein [Clostridia bacterium]
MKKINLNGIWLGKCIDSDKSTEFSFNATVPGCVHSDLKGIRIPEDIYYRDNTDKCQWIEEKDWEYSKVFRMEQKPKTAKLVFEGLDTYCDIYLNGNLLGKTDNMFISHSFDIAEYLSEGENLLSVCFHSPVKTVEGLPHCPGAFSCERMHTRRIQCTYGWDWVARYVTCGIWRDVYIDTSDGFKVENAYIYTECISDKWAEIVVEAEFSGYENGAFADMEIISPDGKSIYKHRFFRKENYLKTYINIPDAKLWYPAGLGKQPLYKLILCGREFIFGIRTVHISELPDKEGSPYYNKCIEIKDSISGREYDRNEEFSGFQLIVNNIPVMCKGANWVPSEPLLSEETDEKITTLLELAKEANLNMLRVWGGGIFEKQHFYNECDRLGILVTQDFLMACGDYPEYEDSFIEQIKKEAEFAALALRNHPCLMWWSGDNENAVNGFDEAEDYHGRTAIHKGIFPVLNRLDPKRRFLLSSPCGGTPYASKTAGTTHNTQYLGCSIFPYIMDSDMKDYKEHFSQYLARFIAEEPTTGAVSLPSLRKFMTDEDIYESDDMWNYHTKSNPALSFSLFDVLLNFTKKVTGDFTDGHDRYFKMKYIQYEWIRISMENIRRNRGFINGIVYWMWNDCWPASSGWAFVDYYCLPKASFYSFKRCAGNIITSIDKKDGYNIYVCNDSLENEEITLKISYLKAEKLTDIREFDVISQRQESQKVLSLPLQVIPEDAIVICDAYYKNGHDRSFYKDGTLPLVPCNSLTVTEKTENSITVYSDKYTHAVELEGEFIFSDNYFSLLPGETRKIFFRPATDKKCDDISLTAYTIV